VPGDHCRFCKAKPICPKLRGESGSVHTHNNNNMISVWSRTP